MVLGIVTASISSGLIISKTGRMTIFFWVGSVLVILGMALISTLDVDTPYWKIALYLLVSGFGTGLMIQTRILALQAAVDGPRIAVATALSNFFQTLGGGIGIAVFGVIFTNQVYSSLLANIPSKYASPEEIRALANAPNAIRTIVKGIPGGDVFILPIYLNAFVIGLRYAFYAAIPFAGLIFIAAFFVKQYGLTKSGGEPTKVARSEEESIEMERAVEYVGEETKETKV